MHITPHSIVLVDPSAVPLTPASYTIWGMSEGEYSIFYQEVQEGHTFIVLSLHIKRHWTLMSTRTAITFDNICEDIFGVLAVPQYYDTF